MTSTGHPDSEIVFVVEEASEGGFVARSVGDSIFTDAATSNSCVKQSTRRWLATSRKKSGRRLFAYSSDGMKSCPDNEHAGPPVTDVFGVLV